MPIQPPITGLSALGQVLQQGSADYANRKLSLEDEARRRSERLADVGSERQYQTSVFDKQRAYQLADELRRRQDTLTDTQKLDAMRQREAALKEAVQRGLLLANQIGDTAAEDAALLKLGEQLAKEATFAQAQPENAQTRLAQLAKAEHDVTGRMAQLEARLSSQPQIDQAQVQNAAIEAATQLNGGKPPSRDQIAQALPDVLAKAQQEATMRWYQDKSDAQVQYQILSSQLNQIRAQQSNLQSTFKVAPAVSSLIDTVGPAPALVEAPRAGGGPLADFTAQLNSKSPPVPRPTADLTLQDVAAANRVAPAGARPALRQAGTSILADEYAKFDAPVESTAAKLDAVNSQLQRAQSGLNPFQGVNPAPLTATPEATGEFITRLILQKSALEGQLRQEQQARSQGRTSALSNLQINTPSQTIPVLTPSAGSVLSDSY